MTPGCGENVVVWFEEQVDHEADDFARREVVARRLVGGFVEPADEVLEDVAHLRCCRPARDAGRSRRIRDDLVEAIGLLQLLDFLLELEVLEDFPDVLGETLDVVGEMPADVVRVALELLEVELAVIVKPRSLPLSLATC